MVVFLFLLGVAQCAFIWYLGNTGRNLQKKAARDKARANTEPESVWPACAMIIPVAGEHPNMEAALRSLFEQNYPRYMAYLVTASNNDPAVELIQRLQAGYGNVRHVTAGNAEHCGQKNYNLLAGVRAASKDAAVFVFCDSTHLAQNDFLRCLVLPIACGEDSFCTGYHQVEPNKPGIAALGYAMSVLFMRFMQGLSAFIQPWGGALAISRQAFERYKIEELWQTNVVDDCSLAAWLREQGAHVHLCPGALLETPVNDHTFSVWRAWLKRQILFLKFCMPDQWLALGFLALLMVLPPFWCVIAIIRGLLGIGGDMNPFLALCWLCLAAWAISGWGVFFSSQIKYFRWTWAFFCACALFAATWLSTIRAKTITWSNAIYKVGKKGVVAGIFRQ